MRELRDFFIVLVFGLVALIAIDHFWFGGRYLSFATHEYGLDISAVRRH